MRELTENETRVVCGGEIRPDKPFWNPYTDPKSMPGDDQDQKYQRYEQMMRYILGQEGQAVQLPDGSWLVNEPNASIGRQSLLTAMITDYANGGNGGSAIITDANVTVTWSFEVEIIEPTSGGVAAGPVTVPWGWFTNLFKRRN